MGIFRIIFYILLGYVLFQIIRLIFTARKVVKEGYNTQQARGKKEKDISRVAKILGEKRLDEKDKKTRKKK